MEKPRDPKTIPGDPDHCLVNMGVYLFDTESLVRELSRDARRPESSNDFGKNIIPAMVEKGLVYAHPFRDDKSGQPLYWRDIGTLDSYFETSMNLVSRRPEFDLYDRKWPFRAWQPPVPPSKSVHGYTEDGTLPGIVEDSIVGSGSIISGGRVERSIVGREVRVNSHCRVTESIIFDSVTLERNVELKRCIVDKNVVIPAGMRIGFDREKDGAMFKVSKNGVVVIPKEMVLKET